jgi:hypothetical protein
VGINEMNDIITEINQELRQDRGRALWKKYGIYVIGFAVAIVVVVAGRQGLVAYLDGQRIAAANAYFTAVNADTNEALSTLGAEDGEGYPMLARFTDAGRLAVANDPEAEAAYLSLSRDETIARIYRDAATVMSVMNAAPETDVNTRIDRISTLAESEGPWQQVAIEVLIGLTLEKGDTAEARNQLKTLRSNQNLSAEENQRVFLLEEAIGE